VRPSEAPVVVLGWAGSTPRQLRPAVRLHEARGAAARAVPPDILAGMAGRRGFGPQGRAIARGLDGGPWVLHAFSNGGFFLAAALLEHAPRPPEALILDSAPGIAPAIDPRDEAPRAAMAMMPSLLAALGRPPALRHRWLDGPLRAFMQAWMTVRGDVRREMERAHLAVRARTHPAPVLLLYGDRDPLVPRAAVEAFAEHLGPRAHRHPLEGVGHVRGLFSRSHEYRESIASFLVAPLTHRRC
jgi:alpha-beta hydrolase superfamily lysophospholipase